MIRIDTDGESRAEIYQLTDGPRPTDNIYGEQPYSSPDSRWIAVRHYREGDEDGGLSLVNLEDGSLAPVLTTMPRFPAFHPWSEYLYYQEEAGGHLVLKRCRYETREKEEVLGLPSEEGRFSYGTVSADHRYYAASVHRDDYGAQVLAIEIATGDRAVLARNAEQYYKHEQFSSDGTNRVLIQANGAETRVVNLGVMAVDGEGIEWLPVDAPPLVDYGHWPGGERHTPRCTGHESWIGQTDRVFLSTGADEERGTNIWTAGLGDAAPQPVNADGHRFGHVSVSRCGRYWIADAGGEDGVPIYAGSFAAGTCRHLLDSKTVHDGQQWSHTHPYLTADNNWLIFTSTRQGVPQVFGARVPEEFWEGLEGQAD